VVCPAIGGMIFGYEARHGSNVVKPACLVDRPGVKAGFKLPFVMLICCEVEAWDKKGCFLCEKGTPLAKPVGRLYMLCY
jgi:hypothetical protein